MSLETIALYSLLAIIAIEIDFRMCDCERLTKNKTKYDLIFEYQLAARSENIQIRKERRTVHFIESKEKKVLKRKEKFIENIVFLIFSIVD